jgi:hypothetical protein
VQLGNRQWNIFRREFDVTHFAKTAKNLVAISEVAGSPERCLVKSLTCVLLLLVSAAPPQTTHPSRRRSSTANKVDGVHPGYRAFHAKGVVVEGTFRASAELRG